MFGTGGQILAMFKQVMGVFAMLHTLELRDLLLDGCEGVHLLDDVCGGRGRRRGKDEEVEGREEKEERGGRKEKGEERRRKVKGDRGAEREGRESGGRGNKKGEGRGRKEEWKE